MAGITAATPTSEFNGQSFIIIFNEVEDYTSATVDSITGEGFDVGQVFQGSTTWTGEDPSFEDVLDEQGDIIVSNPTKGTYGYDFEMADFSAAKMKESLKAEDMAATTAESSFGAGAEIVGTTDAMPIITRPIALVNDTQKKAIFFPKARILTGPTMEDKLFVLKSVVKAQDCNIKGKFGTFMLIDKIKLNFKTATTGV